MKNDLYKSNKTNFRPRYNIPAPDKNSVLVFSLGGVSQIGMNWTLYGHDGQWVLVDAGSAFAPRDLPMVEAIFPDPEIINSLGPHLKGLVVTHAHEDHIGAIHRLWPLIKCPIYATPFAADCLSSRFSERGSEQHVDIIKYSPGEALEVGPFAIDTVSVTHSVPECVALAFKCSAGTLLHTGDWKLDPSPVVGNPTDIAKLKQIGRQGVLAMICDSTNAMRTDKRTSESDLQKGFEQVFKDSRGMVIVSCFSTNIARVATILKAASATGREVAIAGRSLLRNEEIARNLGMLDGFPKPLSHHRHLYGLSNYEKVLVCTGAQGESRAALSRMSFADDWRLPMVGPGDTVIHSARVIPGNEDDINEIFDRYRDMGVDVIERDYNGLPLHVTGHATSGELLEMYKIIKPRFAIPVHGSAEHLAAHANLALKAGVEDVIKPVEGGIYSVSRNGIRKVGEITVDLVAELGDEAHTKISWDEASFRLELDAAQALELPTSTAIEPDPRQKALMERALSYSLSEPRKAEASQKIGFGFF